MYREGSQEGFTPKVAKELWESVCKEAAVKRDLGERLTAEYRQYMDEKVKEISRFKEVLLQKFQGRVDSFQQQWAKSKVLERISLDTRQ